MSDPSPLPDVPLATMLDALPEALVVLDSSGSIVGFNRRAEDLWGHAAADVLGRGAEVLAPKTTEGTFAERLRRYFDAPENVTADLVLTYRALHRDGHEIPLQVRSAPLATASGLHILITVRDAYELEQAGEAVAEARHREAVLEFGRLALTETSLQELAERAVTVAVEVLGVDRAIVSELRGDDLVRRATAGTVGITSDVIPVSRAPMSARALATGSSVQRGGPGQKPVPEILSQDGIGLAAVIPIMGASERFGVLGAYRIGEGRWTREEVGFLESLGHLLAAAVEGEAARREVTEVLSRLQAILDNSPVIIAIKDLEGRYSTVNRRFRELIGLSEATAAGLRSSDHLRPQEADVIDAHEREVLSTGEAIEREETLALADGAHTFRTLKFPMRDADGRVYGIGIIANDVTEGLRGEAERADLEARLHRVDRLESIGRLAGGIAHDFNNLLAVIRNYAQFLVEDLPEGSQSREDLEQIRRAVDRATALTKQLLIFARKERSAPRPLQLNEIIDDTQRLLQRTLGEDIRMHCELQAELPAVELDPTQAEQVLVNLVLNARDAMPEGGTLEIRTVTSSLGHVRMTVTDTGTGMDPAVADRAFEPFFTSKPEGQGTGLGLAMVYGVITGAGGTVDLTSALGQGTTVSVTLPASDEPAWHEPTPEQDSTPEGRGETIMLVEDADALRDLTRRILVEGGYKVLEARNGMQALRVVTRQGPADLLLTDVVMPGMSGRDLALRLLERRSDLPVVFMSGYTDDALLGDELADVPLLSKPFDADQLLRAVREELDRAGTTAGERREPG